MPGSKPEIRTYACGLLVLDGNILLGRRSAARRLYPAVWDVLGGKVEAGETVEQALVRELGEEIGIMANVFEYAGIVEDFVPAAGGLLSYRMFLVRDWTGGEPRICNNEHSEIAWYSAQDAAAISDLAVEDYRRFFISIAARI